MNLECTKKKYSLFCMRSLHEISAWYHNASMTSPISAGNTTVICSVNIRNVLVASCLLAFQMPVCILSFISPTSLKTQEIWFGFVVRGKKIWT